MTDFPKPFKSKIAYDIFVNKYKHDGCETWQDLSRVLVEDVCQDYMSKEDKAQLIDYMYRMCFIAGGRYLYYAGRPVKFFNNCYLLRAEEDTREDWANISWKAESCLLTGGGIGVDYSRYRDSNQIIRRTGGKASGPIPKMFMVNEIGRNVIQGGSRRSAIYASLNHKHGDINRFLETKDWDSQLVKGLDNVSIGDLKRADFNYNAPLDMTNISVNYDTEWLMNYLKTGDYGSVFLKNCEMALKNGEPGFSFNFFDKENETLRNACTEVTSEDSDDVCNLGSLNFANIKDIQELKDVVELATKFLICGTLRAHLPYEKVYRIREKNRRLGLGIMGLHEWLLSRKLPYEVSPELHSWLTVYEHHSNSIAKQFVDHLGISTCAAIRAIAPTGTISMLADTTSGIEPLYAVAYKRRYLVNGNKYKYQYKVDSIAHQYVEKYGYDPEKIESASDLAEDYERRIKFQADVQDYVDMSISSTINLPTTGSINPKQFAGVVAKYASRLRGLTVYPDGARGGQPLTKVPYQEVKDKLGIEFEEASEVNDVCIITGKGGFCSV